MLIRPDALALSYEFEPRRLGRPAVQVSLVIAVILVALMASVIAMNWRRGRRPRAYHATGAPRSAPGGIGRIHGGLVGTLMSTAAAADLTVAAVTAYQPILFSLPLVVSVRSWHPSAASSTDPTGRISAPCQTGV